MEWLSGWTAWLIFGFILLILETLIAGIFIMWWGFAAIIVAILLILFPNIELGWKATIFAVLAILFSLAWWKYQHSKDQQEDQQADLNARDHAMIGLQGTVVEVLDSGVARGKFGDTTWRVIGNTLKVGDNIQVEKVDGITLFVRVV
ncbi:NfeD family protein [Glaesserella parasuis]|nr:NfeD family protein [Glaesserella parasuis]MCT8612339.1 NfeD family protein [Glaesserella parasuis]MCT8648896.1 NfeD family protein [Glaesserella parasuis]MCT8658998.1 NfeD family protein [Glaesserella parasuis]MDE3933673.1 NfeD family protein [Glaesserella parasuis]